jgi:hypothetical protein
MRDESAQGLRFFWDCFSLDYRRANAHAELRAGSPRRPYRGALAAATDESLGGSEMRPA